MENMIFILPAFPAEALGMGLNLIGRHPAKLDAAAINCASLAQRPNGTVMMESLASLLRIRDRKKWKTN